MSQSETLDELFAALSAAQGKMHGAKKDRDNPHFKAKFAGLSATWDACREALSENGLAVVQTVEPTADGNFLVTTLGHKSGQWIRGEVPLIMDREGMQPLGSAITYARRYGLQAAIGIAPVDDDDAEGATDHEKKPDIIGQLNKTALKEKMRAFDRDLHRTTNDAEIDRVLEDYAEVLDQCKRELPGWWRSDPKRDFKGPPDRIETQRQAVRGMEPPPPDPLPNPEAEREGPQESAGSPRRAIVILRPQGGQREFPATNAGALEALSDLEAQCAINPDAWQANKAMILHMAQLSKNAEVKKRALALEAEMEQTELASG